MPIQNNDKVSVEETKVGLQTRIAEAAAGLEEEVAKNDTHEKVVAPTFVTRGALINGPQPQPTQTGLLSMFTELVDRLRLNGYRVDDASFNACSEHISKPALLEATINIVVRGFQITGGGNA